MLPWTSHLSWIKTQSTRQSPVKASSKGTEVLGTVHKTLSHLVPIWTIAHDEGTVDDIPQVHPCLKHHRALEAVCASGVHCGICLVVRIRQYCFSIIQLFALETRTADWTLKLWWKIMAYNGTGMEQNYFSSFSKEAENNCIISTSIAIIACVFSIILKFERIHDS